VEWSLDAGRHWSSPDYVSAPDAVEGTISVSGESNTAQYRLTLYPNTTALTMPEVQAVVMRGNPIVRAPKQWSFLVNGGEMVATKMPEAKVSDNEDRIRQLLLLSDRTTPVTFRSLDGMTYRVVVRPYTFKPRFSRDKTKLSMTIEVTLEQAEAAT